MSCNVSMKPQSTWTLLKPHSKTWFPPGDLCVCPTSFNDTKKELWENDPVDYIRISVSTYTRICVFGDWKMRFFTRQRRGLHYTHIGSPSWWRVSPQGRPPSHTAGPPGPVAPPNRIMSPPPGHGQPSQRQPTPSQYAPPPRGPVPGQTHLPANSDACLLQVVNRMLNHHMAPTHMPEPHLHLQDPMPLGPRVLEVFIVLH